MRHPRLALTALASSAAAVLALPGGAVAQSFPDACDGRALNPERRQVERFKAGEAVLPYGRVVMQATKANPHLYCLEVQFGARTVTHESSNSSDVWKNGRWVYEGASGSGVYRAKGYERTVQIKKLRRSNLSFSIRDGGRWYTVRISKGRPGPPAT